MKPLIKHEIKRIVPGTIILAIVSVLTMGFMLNAQIDYWIRRYIRGGGVTDFMNILTSSYMAMILFSAVGIIWLVYSQFHEDKVEGTGDFIASLPYTQKENYINKVIAGGLGIICAFLVSTVICYISYLGYGYYQEHVYVYNLYGEQIRAGSGFLNIIGLMLNGYIGIFIWYMFLVIVQYSVYNTWGSIVISCLMVLAFPYLSFGIDQYIYRISRTYDSIGSKVMEFIVVLGRCIVPTQDKYVSSGYDRVWIYTGLSSDYLIQLLLLIVICAICILIGKLLAEIYGLRNRKTFMVNKGTEWVFKIGVALCSAFIPFYFFEIFMYGLMSIVVESIFMLVFGCIGYFISNKIAMKGSN